MYMYVIVDFIGMCLLQLQGARTKFITPPSGFSQSRRNIDVTWRHTLSPRYIERDMQIGNGNPLKMPIIGYFGPPPQKKYIYIYKNQKTYFGPKSTSVTDLITNRRILAHSGTWTWVFLI